MVESSRRWFLAATSGLTTALVGCSGLIQSDQADAPDVETPEQTSGQGDDRGGGGSTEPSLDDLTVELSYEIDGQERNMWRLVNESSSMLQMATVTRQVSSDLEGINLESGRYVTFAVPPGGQREFLSSGQTETEIRRDGTWFTNQNQAPSGQADTTSAPRGITKLENPTAPSPFPAKLDYVIPNPTEIALTDIREARLGGYELRIGSDGFRYTSERPLWADVFDVTVDGTTTSETFTWTASPAPQVDIEVAGELGDLNVTLTAQSATPVLNAVIYVVALGPSVNADDRARATYRERARVTDDATTTALITDSVGEQRVGQSRTVTLPYNTGVDYPIDKEEDRLIVGVASSRPAAGYPVSSVELPLSEFV